MGWLRFLTLGINLVLLIQNVNSSATCVEKFVAGEDANTRYEYVVGDRITLRCDVSARDPAKDMVYWKYDSLVFSQDNNVIATHQAKYTVTLDNQTSIYTISWIAEVDDAGKYNCTCTTGGLQFPVWIKVPCNERIHVINDTTPSNGTSQEVLDYLDDGKIPELEDDQSLNFSLALDCGCTWPEVNRTFTGVWYTKDPKCTNLGLPGNSRVHQNTSKTPVGCATKQAVTYRYNNVSGHFDSVNFTCTKGMCGIYDFYIDEGQSTRPEPVMKINCSTTTTTTTTITPTATTKTPTATTITPTATTITPTDCSCECPCIPIVEITLGVTAAVTLICIVVAIVTNHHTEDAKPQRCSKKDIFITLSVVEIIALICIIAVFCWCIQSCKERCPGPGPCKVIFPTLAHIIALAIILIVTIAVIIFCIVKIYKSNKGTEPKRNESHDNNGFNNTKLADGGIWSHNENVPPSRPQPNGIRNYQIPLSEQSKMKSCVKCMKNPVQVYFKPCGHAAACTSCAESMLGEYSKKPSSALCPECKASVTGYQNKICVICSKNPVQVYSKSCGHANVCNLCTRRSDNAPAACCPCGEPIKDIQKVCVVCFEKPVLAHFAPCHHKVVCQLCADNMKKKSVACPICNKMVQDYTF